MLLSSLDNSAFHVSEMVLVDWIDSYMAHGWEDRKERLNHDRKPGICRSVGFLVEDNADWITLSECISASDNVGCTTTIPKVAVQRMVALVECQGGD